VADPPVVARLRVVMKQLSEYAQRGEQNKYSRYAWVMQSMFDEIMDELAGDTDETQIAGWFEQFGRIIEWCGSGNDATLPPSVRTYLATQHPGMLAIEAPAMETV
jgi:hypothetical protein